MHTTISLKTYRSHKHLINFSWFVIILATICKFKAYEYFFVYSVCQERNVLKTLSYGTQCRGSSMNTCAPDTTSPPPLSSLTLLHLITRSRFLVNYELHSPPRSRRHKVPPKRQNHFPSHSYPAHDELLTPAPMCYVLSSRNTATWHSR